MKEQSRNVAVGVTALAGLAGLAMLLMMFGYVPQMLEKGYCVRVELDHAGGLTKGSLARLSGIRIGRVTSIDLAEPPKIGVVAMLLIDEGIAIPQAVNVTVGSQILTGSPWLEFEIPEGLSSERLAKTLPTDGRATLQGHVPERVRQFAGELRTALEGSVNSIKDELRKPLVQFDRMEQNFDDLSRQWVDVGKRLNDIIEDRPVDQVDAGKIKGNLTTVLKRMDQRLAEMKDTLGGARQWLDKASDASGEVETTGRKIGVTADNAARNLDQLTQRYVALADGLSKAIDDMQKLAAKASDGKGAMGKLLNDPALYDNLNDTAERIGQTADELKLLIEKWKAEGLPVQF